MKKQIYRVTKDTFKHEQVGSYVVIVENIDMPKVQNLKTGLVFYCPIDNLVTDKLGYYSKKAYNAAVDFTAIWAAVLVGANLYVGGHWLASVAFGIIALGLLTIKEK